jgi:RNA polymerase sigma-70 factor (ECF subfamily)
LAIQAETLYRKYGPMVLRRCRQLLRDEHAAQDVMHDVFVKVLQNESRLDDRAPSSLLFRIATNESLNRLRSAKRRPETRDDELLMQIASAEDAGAQSEARSFLARLFSREQESTRTMAVLHWVDGMTLEEVAREVGMSVSGVRKRLRGLRAQLDLIEEVAA